MDVFVARQPIFDSKKRVTAYELLFRSSLENLYTLSQEGDQATNKLIVDSFLVIGLDNLTGGKRAFINFTKNLLLKGAPTIIPKDLVAVEVLETVYPDDLVIMACKELKQQGYVIVLDDFVFHEDYRQLVELADIIKVDFQNTRGKARKTVLKECVNSDVTFLAEKVETADEFEEACRYGYALFQGYFFSKPVVVSGRDIPGNKVSYLRVLHEVNRPEVDFEKIEEIVKRDVALSFKLLKFINSAFFGLSVKVQSIRHALVLLGTKEIKKWVSLIALSNLASDKPQELLTIALVRARFCERIASRIGCADRSSDFFMMGLFSVIDALIDKTMSDILSDLPISEDVKSALLGQENTLHAVYQLILSYEKGAWEQIGLFVNKLNLSDSELPEFYFDALKWATIAFA